MALELDEIDPSWTETHHFNDDEIAEAYELARLRFGNASVNLRRSDLGDLEINAWGWLGEWAVDDSLGYPRSKDTSGKSDDGIDLVLDCGTTLQIKNTTWRGAGFMLDYGDPRGMQAQYGVSCCPHGQRKASWPPETKAVDIVGGFGRLEWEDLRQRRDFRHGPLWTVWPRFLIPWVRLREVWTHVEQVMPSLPAQQLAL